MKTIGVWLPEKKSQKLNWKELRRECEAHGFKLIQLNIEIPLEEQEPIDVLLHKFTVILTSAEQGDPKNKAIVNRLEQFLSNRPDIIIVDPFDKVRILLQRYRTYSILENELSFQSKDIFTPAFALFTSSNHERNLELLKQRNVTFPLVCKTSLAHGSKSDHEMVLILNERGLRVCKPPCVVQSFVNHNAVLYKVCLVGNRYCICERPSLKNFYPSEDMEPIFYSTSEVCKADSQSTLSILDPNDQPHADIKMNLDETKIRHIIHILRKEIGLLLMGFDVIIDNSNGYHAVIDVNVFPSYDNFPNFFGNLLECIEELSDRRGRSKKEEGVSDRMNGLVNVGLSSLKMGVAGANIIS